MPSTNCAVLDSRCDEGGWTSLVLIGTDLVSAHSELWLRLASA